MAIWDFRLGFMSSLGLELGWRLMLGHEARDCIIMSMNVLTKTAIQMCVCVLPVISFQQTQSVQVRQRRSASPTTNFTCPPKIVVVSYHYMLLEPSTTILSLWQENWSTSWIIAGVDTWSLDCMFITCKLFMLHFPALEIHLCSIYAFHLTASSSLSPSVCVDICDFFQTRHSLPAAASSHCKKKRAGHKLNLSCKHVATFLWISQLCEQNYSNSHTWQRIVFINVHTLNAVSWMQADSQVVSSVLQTFYKMPGIHSTRPSALIHFE